MEGHTRNQLKGMVVEIQDGAVNGIIFIDVGNGNKIAAAISMKAIKELELKVGAEVYAIIRATPVMVSINK